MTAEEILNKLLVLVPIENPFKKKIITAYFQLCIADTFAELHGGTPDELEQIESDLYYTKYLILDEFTPSEFQELKTVLKALTPEDFKEAV